MATPQGAPPIEWIKDPYGSQEYANLCTGYVLTWKGDRMEAVYLTVDGGLAVMKKWLDGEPMIVVHSGAFSTAMIASIEPQFRRVFKNKPNQEAIERGEYVPKYLIEQRISRLSLPTDLAFGALQGGSTMALPPRSDEH